MGNFYRKARGGCREIRSNNSELAIKNCTCSRSFFILAYSAFMGVSNTGAFGWILHQPASSAGDLLRYGLRPTLAREPLQPRSERGINSPMTDVNYGGIPGNRVVRLEHEGKTYVLIGLADHSPQNLADADRLIEEAQPGSVCLELCDTRFHALTDEAYWKKLKVVDALRQGRGLLLLAGVATAAYLHREGHEGDYRLGEEMLGRRDRALELGIPCHFSDRDIDITLKRFWSGLRRRRKARIFVRLVRGLFSRKKRTDAILAESRPDPRHGLFAALTRYLPEAASSIEESNQYFCGNLLKAEGPVVVAVLNDARIPSVCSFFHREMDHEALTVQPERSKLRRLIPVLITLVLLGFLGWAVAHTERLPWRAMVLAWVIPNSALTGFFAVVGGARLLSILTAMAVSPFTPLSPVIRSGLAVGFVEGWLRKPLVLDCERIPKDIRGFKTIYRNPLTRVLWVAWLTHTGSSLGNYVGLFLLVRAVSQS